MAKLFTKLKVTGTGTSHTASIASPKHKKDEPTPELTPLEKMLQNAGPIREDGSDKFFGLENFGNTCYCNSIVQALYFSESFRENVVNYPPLSPSDTPNGKRKKVNVSIRSSVQANGNAAGPAKGQKPLTAAQALKARQAINSGQVVPGAPGTRPEDKPDSPEYKKKQAMIKGPVLELASENPDAYGMQECTFTGLKDIFTALMESNSRTGVLSPQRFLDIFKRDNEMFRNSMHQDAHEFYGLVLNDVISSVEANARRMHEREESRNKDGLARSVEHALGATAAAAATSSSSAIARGTRTPGTGWVHDIFEGVLTSETRCLTCETASQRDETFLDLSIDLEEHSSVTSCLSKFSAEEMLCERNKFHCDHCGGLQEAEKRMKIKKLPKVLALHLKRFKYTEDYSRLQKLFHRVVYPYYLRMFNTTDDAEDPDRMYELYAVVVHVGGNAYHGHYVSVIKTQDRGWLLFDDEMVEPVDKHFVRNFFGDKPGMACAYVLFYQETTFQKMREEQDAEGLEEVRLASEKADLAQGSTDQANGIGSNSPLSKLNTVSPVSAIPVDDREALVTLEHAQTAPEELQTAAHEDGVDGGDGADGAPATSFESAAAPPVSPTHLPATAATNTTTTATTKSSKSKSIEMVSRTPTKSARREKKEQKAQEKAAEKARKAAEKEEAKLEEKKRAERYARMREARVAEREELERAMQESKQTAAAESEKRRREKKEDKAAAAGEKKDTAAAVAAAAAEEAGNTTASSRSDSRSPGLLGRNSISSRPLTRRSFPFLSLSKDKGDNRREKGEKGGSSSHKAEKGEHRLSKSEKPESSTTTTTTASATVETTQQQQQQQQHSGNGNSSNRNSNGHNHQTSEKEKEKEKERPDRALRERFSFALGRKKSQRFLS